MPRIAVPAREAAPPASQPLLDAVEKKLGAVPNLFRLMALNPPVLQGFLGLDSALGHTLDLKTRQRIALVTAQINGCDYCLSAHSYVGVNLAGMDAADVALARRGQAAEAKPAAAVAFAAKVAATRGKVAAADLQAVRDAGYGDADIVAIVALVAENIFTNTLNLVADTEIDFPVVRAAQAA